MSELLPTVQAGNVHRGLVDYLTTTFALSDADVRDGLDRFLCDPSSGMFKGPYVRLRLPFRPADDGWRDALEWFEGFPPYSHQAAAFRRLSTSIAGQRHRPEPTLVTTGTGSGKTEAFLHPIIDHVLRARRDGVTGTKALILYPMNALANDQAKRLTEMLTGHTELGAITAALYTGQSGPTRTSVTADGLITDRAVIRDTAPDILLTNYKMLDQLLLRHDDQQLWRRSATSLQYLVLDEFHTYDGAQGTDVAMLLRRLGLALKSHWRDDDPAVTDTDRQRPLGRMAPVATSATLGDKGDPEVMLGFAETVFGVPFGPDAVITESRLSLDEWAGDAAHQVTELGLTPIATSTLDLATANASIAALGHDPDAAELTRAVLNELFDDEQHVIAFANPERLLLLARAHPLVHVVAEAARDAVSLDELVSRTVGESVSFGRYGQGSAWVTFLSSVVAALGHIRSQAGRGALSVEAHLWVRELTRIDRTADTTAAFRWSDDGPPAAGEDHDDARPSYPAVYCRHCGRSGWGVGLSPVGGSLSAEDESIRRNHAQHEGRFRALLHAPTEAEQDQRTHADKHLTGEQRSVAYLEGLVWFSVLGRSVDPHRPDEDDPELLDGLILPVLTTTGDHGDEQAKDDTCPACGQEDGIRFLGSAIATLLSVSLSTLFGSAELAAEEKKALVFTDSVQDAAHRAGFVQARSHALTLRAVLRASVEGGALSLDQLVEEVIRAAGDNSFDRYRLLAPDCADRQSFVPFWEKRKARSVPVAVQRRVRKRLALDVALEFGLNSRTGRTLELTGSVAAEVDAGAATRMAGVAHAATDEFSWQERLDGRPTDSTLIGWVRGVLDRMRAQGAIDHPWFETYRQEDGNRWRVSGGRPRSDGMPAFPPGRPTPGYPRVGGGEARRNSSLDPVTATQTWYAQWTSRILGVSPHDGGLLARRLLERLAHDGVLTVLSSESGGSVYALPTTSVVVSPTTEEDLRAGRHLLACDTCHATTPGSITTVDQLDGAPCTVIRCRGRLGRSPLTPGFYRTLYGSSDVRRVVAREHTSLLDDATRLAYENGFKAAAASPQSPNVLVATPTLEMGIDIGDLSAVFLASLPRTVASYLQRVGRAGRLTGNALNLAYVTGRGEHLPKLGDPLSVINGEVRPPATYLQAEEILRRQYLAHLVDRFARDPVRPHPQKSPEAIGSTEPGSFLGELLAHAEEDAAAHVDRFVAMFSSLPAGVVGELRTWASPQAGPGTSGLAAHLHDASRRWQVNVEILKHRLDAVDALLPELEKASKSPASTEDDARALRSAKAARKLTSGQLAHLRGEYWIGVLEEHGVLPNYTLLDDAVVLDVGISWTDPDTQVFQSEHAQLQRGSAQAIREFAPGATFYARGWEIAIDAVDLGVDGGAVRPWVFCPACGYARDVETDGKTSYPTSCPRCGSSGIADTGQRLDVVELTHVTAEVRRDEATISDRRDERSGKAFQLMVTADVDEQQVVSRWFVGDGVGLGCTYVRAMDVRWVNLGTPGHGSSRTISGEERSGALFRVCEGCGKLDTVAGKNMTYEHRPWCRHRASAEEHNATIALSRTLRTQGLLVRLPYSVTIGDDFAVPSLSAALLLGLREQLGGHPDHIQVERVVEPTLSDGSGNHDAILLHDVVPGGTGYLAEMAGPVRLRDLLVRAWLRVRDCECRTEDRLACHRCLLPFVALGAVRRVSRAAAERHLRTLLALPDDAETADESSWDITNDPPHEDVESHLEQRFRQILVERLTAAGASVHETPGPWGNTVRITVPGGRRQWTLTPQEHIEGCRPDFVLRSSDTTVPTVVIFTDGRAYHAAEEKNRLADDATKREILRDTGYVVLGVSSRDVRAKDEEVAAPDWFSPSFVKQLISETEFQTSPESYARLAKGPIGWIVDWIHDPRPAEQTVVANAVPMFFGLSASMVSAAAETSLGGIARAALRGEEMEGDRQVAVYRSGPLAVVIEFADERLGVAAVLDDRPGQLDEVHADAWREWLRLSNALALREWPTIITTLSRTEQAPVPAPAPTDRPDLIAEWSAVWQDAAEGLERDLVVALASHTGLATPVIGDEGPDGIMLDMAWTDRKSVVDVRGMPEQDRADLEAAGWTVLPPDADTIASRLGTTTTEGVPG